MTISVMSKGTAQTVSDLVCIINATFSAGDTVIVCMAGDNTSTTLDNARLTDASNGNIRVKTTPDITVTNTGGVITNLYYFENLTSSEVSQIVHVVARRGASSGDNQCVSVYSVAGLATSSPLDKSSAATGTDAPYNTGTSGALTQADEVAIAVIGIEEETDQLGAWTTGAGYVSGNEQSVGTTTGGARSISIATAAKITTTTDAQQGNMSAGAPDWAALIATFLGGDTQPILTVQGSTHAQTADNVVLTQYNTLATAGAAQAQTADSPSLIQHNILAVDAATQAQTADNVELTYSAPIPTLEVQGAIQAQTADEVALIQQNALTVANASHLQTADEVALTQHNILAVDNATHAQAADNIVITYNAPGVEPTTLTVQGSTHAQTADEVALTQHNALIVDGATQAQTADNVNLTQYNILIVSGSTHAQTADNVELTQHGTLTVAGSTHAQTAENVTLEQHNILAADNASHAQTAGNVDLTYYEPGAVTLTAANAAHAQTADNVVLVQHNTLVVNSSTHAQTADNVTLVQHNVLTVDNSTHAQTADNVVLTENPSGAFTLAVNNASHAQTADNVNLTANNALVVSDATQPHTADNVDLTYYPPGYTEAIPVSRGSVFFPRTDRRAESVAYWRKKEDEEILMLFVAAMEDSD